MHSYGENSDLLVFSHLRWDFVFQRPQHLMTRFARNRRVYYVEEPVFGMTEQPRLHVRETTEKVKIVVPYLPASFNESSSAEEALKELVDDLILSEDIEEYVCWYYTPMALTFTRHLNPAVIMFDCMDELSLFKGAPQSLLDLESELLRKSDLVFTGGQSLYEAKKNRHHNIHACPSSIDFEHFASARKISTDPTDQAFIPHPRIGFYGVIDERMDIDLLEKMADLRPDFQFIMIGPVVKIDPTLLPVRKNIHYLGKKEYTDLPKYMAGWDCAMMPFALNESTRFISPTKTPEFLAAGKPVVSTAITDVVRPYGEEKLVYIASSAEEFISSIESAMLERKAEKGWITRVDRFLGQNSWDMTFERIARLESSLWKEVKVSPVLNDLINSEIAVGEMN